MEINSTFNTRNRLDHLLPQGYLDGFINPSVEGELWAFNKSKTKWFPTGTPAVAAIKGFYDYSEGSNPDATADEAFRELESKFPIIRRELISENFSTWKKHRDLLLTFAQMLRARSGLFRSGNIAATQQSQLLRIVEVKNNSLRYEPYKPKNPKEHASLLRNKAITDMRTEIKKGPSWFAELDWCLRLTRNVQEPFITTDNPVVVLGKQSDLAEAVKDTESLVFFPICWQACLIGSRLKFDVETDYFEYLDMRKTRKIYVESADQFVYSPLELMLDEDLPSR